MRTIALLLALVLALSSCGGVDTPRWSTETESVSAPSFDSPRRVYTVVPAPDIGAVSLRGIVKGRTPITVFAQERGMVLDVAFARNATVRSGETVMTFVPVPTEAELIALEIAGLQVDLARENGATADQVQSLQDTRDELEASYQERRQVVRAPTSGVIGPTRQNIGYRVEAGDELFELSDPGDIVVEITADPAEAGSLRVGDSVSLAPSNDAIVEPFSGQVVEVVVSADNEGNDITIIATVDDPSAFALGDRVRASVAIESVDGALWIPLDAVHRSQGRSFLLQALPESLERIDAELGVSTTTHVQVNTGISVGMQLVLPG